MNTEQERAEFEAWANGRCELHLVNPAGRYSSAITLFAWEAYQAGRAALAAQAQEAASAEQPDPRTPADMLVNGGALKLALNVLRRAGKDEVADELEKTAAPAAQGEPSANAVLEYLDTLKDDAAAHIWPDDLERCRTSECTVEVASVRMGSPAGNTVPLFSRDQVVDALIAAQQKGGA